MCLDVVLIVRVEAAVFRDPINRFALFLPAVCPRLFGVLVAGERQVSGDAVPDAVAQHAVVAGVCGDQLRPVDNMTFD